MDFIPQNPRYYDYDSDSDSSDDRERRLPAYRPGVQDPYIFDSSDSDDDRGPALFEDSSDDDRPPVDWTPFNHRPFTTEVDSDSDSDDDLIPRQTDFANLPVDFFLSKRDFYHDSPFYDSDSSDD